MILVVDDHQETLYAVVRILIYEGYEAKGVASGGEALAFLRQNPVSLVILDFNMPDMDGFEVFHSMRADPAAKAIPVIMFSANDGSIKNRAIEIGISAYVMKSSLDLAVLRREIVRLIGKGKPRQEHHEERRGSKDAG